MILVAIFFYLFSNVSLSEPLKNSNFDVTINSNIEASCKEADLLVNCIFVLNTVRFQLSTEVSKEMEIGSTLARAVGVSYVPPVALLMLLLPDYDVNTRSLKIVSAHLVNSRPVSKQMVSVFLNTILIGKFRTNSEGKIQFPISETGVIRLWLVDNSNGLMLDKEIFINAN